jgi:Nucleotidyl transferase AbiEii toxin, Type IV TA system
LPFGDVYYRQAALLIRAIPHVAQEICFALKGGTAINLFIRNMPRLSVDLDLTYLRLPIFTLASWLRRWIASILATSSTSEIFLPMRASMTRFARPLSSTC